MSSRQRRVALASGVVLELAESGRQGGRTVLALHGEDGPASMAATIDHLGVEHQVIAATHPGWSGTDRAASLNAVAALSRAYLDLLDVDDAVDVVVVGGSFGAWVGAQMATDDTQRRVAALVVIGPIGLHAPRPDRAARPRAGGHRARRGREAGGTGRRRASATTATVSGVLRAYVGPLAHDPTLAARLASVGVPALVVVGDDDQVLPAGGAREWADALGDGHLAIIAGGGHLPCHRAPWATFAAIDAFLSPPLVLTA